MRVYIYIIKREDERSSSAGKDVSCLILIMSHAIILKRLSCFRVIIVESENERRTKGGKC